MLRTIKLDFNKSIFTKKYQEFDKIAADGTHQRSDLEPGVDTSGICVEIIMVDVENSSFGYELISEI